MSSARIWTPLAPENVFCKNDIASVLIAPAKDGNVPVDVPKRIEELVKQTIDLKKQSVVFVTNAPRNFTIEGRIIRVVDNTKHAFNKSDFGLLKIVGDFKVRLAGEIIADFDVNKEHFWSAYTNKDGNMLIGELEPIFAEEVANVLVTKID
jgi:hypothetical protein